MVSINGRRNNDRRKHQGRRKQELNRRHLRARVSSSSGQITECITINILVVKNDSREKTKIIETDTKEGRRGKGERNGRIPHLIEP